MRRIAVGLLLLCVRTAHAGEPPTLRHNPFERPSVNIAVDPSTGPRHAQRLRATLVDGPRSLANIDGVLVGVGDQINDARVTAIGEGTVTLQRDDTRYTLTLTHEQDTRRDEK
ncbi:MAG: hypothetical protein AB8G17_21165 [Gammaproteobacteria bacterium]